MTQNSINYGDIFCQAVSNIVNNSIAQLEFDISRECTIIKINDKAFGKYQVSDGSMSFEAIAGAGTYYEVGDRVMVTIPKGDYNKQISILTKIVDIWSGPAGFVRPLDTIIKCTDNIAVQMSKEALTANGEVKAIEILRLEDQKFLGFQKMGISADFKTLINGLNVIDGTYGLRFSLIELDPEAKDENGNSIRREKQVQQFIFSSKDMLGNPYEFSTYFTQEYAFDMPENFSRIHEVIVEFYQDNNFINGNKQEIEVSKVNNLFVDNLKIYFGYDVNKTLGEIVEIHSDYLTYDSTTTKHIELSWFHKIDENTMQKIDQKSDQNIFGVRWYKYVSGCDEENTDDYGGKNWFLLNPPNNENNLAGSLIDKYPFTTLDPICIEEEFPFSLEAPVLETKEKEQFKAVCLMKTYPYINDPTYEVTESWTSNTLTFDNTKEESSGGESAGEVIEKELSLVFSDNSFGNYFLYDQNGELLDIKEGINKSRSIILYYKGAEINEDNFIDITKIEWSLPNKANSMITYDEKQHDDQVSPKEFTYKILNDLNKSLGDNTIKCSVYVSGQLYVTLYETLRFGKQGSNGTTTTFILEMMDGKNAVVLGDNDGLSVQAILIRETGKRVYFTEDEKKEITWTLLNNNYISQIGNNSDIITLFCNESTIPSDHYTILKAVYQYEDDGPKLEAYLPIPIKKANCDYMIGATQILYNHQGIPKYNNGIYIAKSDNTEYKTWDIKQGNNNPNMVTLKQLQDGKGISASPLFSKGAKKDSSENLLEIQDEVCVYCTHDNEIIWSQPILIMQSQYDFAMLNSWDGSLTIDEKNGTILSTMLGAGRKNDQNQFSGVLIGDIQGGTELEDTETMTGVYGFDDGIMSYALREDGTGFFGAKKNGRIEFNGEHGAIHSYGWTPAYKDGYTEWKLDSNKASKGSVFDLDDGQLQLISNNNNYFKYNDNNSGILEMSLSGANIKLNNKTNNPSLSGYIDATAQGLTSEFRRTAVYTITCKTASTEATKVLPIGDFSKAAFKSGDVGISDLTVENILQDGVTIAVTFTNAENVTTEQVEIKQTIDGVEKVIGHKEKRTGRSLYLKIDTISKQIYINGKATNNTASLNESNEINTNSNSYGWLAGSTIYFIYKGTKDNGYWEVSDSGSYSKITQTADMIRSEVSTIGGNLSSVIIQTAQSITSEVRRTAGYVGTSSSSKNSSTYVVALSNTTSGLTANEIHLAGVTLAITFTNAQENAQQLRLNILNTTKDIYYRGIITSSTNSFTWSAGDTIYFSYYNGYWNIVDSGAYSKIQQTADAITQTVENAVGENGTLTVAVNDITSRVTNAEGAITTLSTNTNGITGTVIKRGDNSFTFNLTNSGFYLNNGNEANASNYKFKCDSTGISIDGGGTFSGTLSAARGTFAGNLSADTTKFNKIEAGAVKIGGKEYFSSFANGEIKLVVGTEDEDGTTNGHGGYFKVGPANEWVGNQYWDDITIWGEVIKEDLTQTGYGNIGTPERKWSWIYVAHDGSQRNMKRNIQRYDSEQAYEELRYLPLYTYQYIGDSDHTRSLFLGSMIDYMPIEFMRTTPDKDGTIFEPNNIIFWNIAASQTIQSKLEDLINRVEQLEQKEV